MFRRAFLFKAPSVAFTALGISEATQARLKAIVSNSKMHPTEREGLTREILHVRRCNDEITKLFQWPEVKSLISSSSDQLSSAELIHLTAFSPSVMVHGRNDVHQHDPKCPIAAGEMSITTMASRDPNTFSAPPCQHCIRRRLNFLASEHFAHGLHWNSIMPRPNATNHINNPRIYHLVKESFGSMRGLEDTLAEFAVNRRDAGFTWLVYNPNASNPNVYQNNNHMQSSQQQSDVPTGRLEAVNLPGSTSPVVLGMWPIACINVTTETIVDAFNEANQVADTSKAPSWSRASRNPSSSGTQQSTAPVNEQTLTDLRRASATKQCQSLDIAFIEAQLGAALDYFASPEYTAAAQQRQADLTRTAQQTVVKSFDNVEMETVRSLKQATAAQDAAAKTAAAAAAAKASTDATATLAAATSATSSTVDPVPDKAEEGPSPDTIVAEGMCDDGTTRYTTRQNGIVTYSYANGTTTDVYPDGRQVAYTSGLTTTSYPDGTVHYLYANGATVEIRPDGTKYVNGVLETTQS